MGVFKTVVGGTFKSMVDVPSWLGYKYIKQHTLFLYQAFKGISTPLQATRKESFAEALQRLNLTEAELDIKRKSLIRSVIIFVIASAVAFIYMGYLFIIGQLFGGVISLLLTCVFLVKAFEASFWNFQIKHRKLGCNFKEWLSGRLEESQQ